MAATARPLPQASAEPVIRVKNLSIGWGDTIIQKDLSFDVNRG